MPKSKDLSKYEISDFSPAWLNLNFPNNEEYEEIKDIMKFYLINSPCTRSSSRGTDVKKWGKPSIVLLERLKNEIGLENGKNFEYSNSGPEMKALFLKYGLTTDFTSVVNDIVVFQLTEGNVFESVFRHIRNAIAHSRWQLINGIYYFEDGSDDNSTGVPVFCVSARIVLSTESLIKWRDLIVNGPNEDEKARINLEQTLDVLLSTLKSKFAGKFFTRKEAVDELKIDNAMWNKLYHKGQDNNVMEFEKKHWRIIP